MSGGRLEEWPGAQAQARPEAAAIVDGETRVSYGELEERSNRLARLFAASGCRPGDRVALLLPKSTTAIVALLAAYKIGAVGVPLDPDGPALRLARIARSSEPRLLLAGAATLGLLEELCGLDALPAATALAWMDPRPAPALATGWRCSANDAEAFSREAPTQVSTPAAAAHLLYTSGSTGEPKGVIVTHASVRCFVEWACEHFGIGGDERLSAYSPLHFDLSTFDLFAAFAAGAELHLVPRELAVLPPHLAAFMRSHELTQWFSVPSLLAYMVPFGVVRRGDLPHLRRLLWCGEVFPAAALAWWMERLPHAAFANLYGPTETTIASAFYDVPHGSVDEAEAVPIGRPCAGEVIHVVDAGMRPVPDGERGEIVIGGAGLSPGYWRDPQRTAERFVADPADGGRRLYRTGDIGWIDADGLLRFAGREDGQIKSRGYRIELGEIEAAVAAIPAVQEAVVVAIATPDFAGRTICCAYAPAQAGDASRPVAVRAALARRLPDYMLPARWMVWDRLPRNGNGKLDRRTLRHAFERDEEREESRRAVG